MSIQRPKISLNNAVFPFVSSKAPRAVFIPQLDTAGRANRGFMGADDNIDYNIPQILYGENFMPVSEGVRSVGYRQLIAPTVNTDFDSIFPLRDDNENTVLYSPSKGKNYIYDETAGMWTTETLNSIWAPLVVDPAIDITERRVTYAYVDGKTFVCYARLKDQVGLAAPVVAAPTTNTVGGTLAAGTYYYQVTAVLNGGESLPSAEVSRVTTGATSTVTLDWPDVPGATSYVIYGRVAGGAKQQLATVTASTYIDTGAATPIAGTALPLVNNAKYDMSIMQWDPVTKTLIPATSILANVPFRAGEIDGISASNGFLLIWSDLTVAWAPFNGSQFNYSSFVNGNFTGAGNQVPEDVQGKITALIPLPGGFVIFTVRNAVAASYYAQSIASPWVFREIPDTGGLESYEQASVEGNLGNVIAYTTAGIQRINLNSSQILYPAVSDFIAGRKTERYDFATHSLIPGGTTVDLFVKVTAISGRYFVISYGYFPGIYSYALVHDLALRRWGKLRIVHRDCFYYTQELEPEGLTYAMLLDVRYSDLSLTAYEDTTGQGEGVSSAQHSLAFLLATGEIVVAKWSDEPRDTPDQAVVVIGRIQFSRSRDTQFNRAELEGNEGCTVFVAPSENGRTLLTPIQLSVVEQIQDYLCVGDLIDCKNFNLIVEGQFNLSTIVLEGAPSGRIG